VHSAAVPRNYAETLLELAERHGGAAMVDTFGETLDELTALLKSEPRVREFLESPLVQIEAKKAALTATFAGRVPDLFLRFVEVVIEKRRGPILTRLASEYQRLVDERRGRVRAEIVLARQPDEALRRQIQSSLERTLGKEVVATYRVDPALVGGVTVLVGEHVFDGSVRRRATELRRRLLAAELPPTAVA
jgi:F-type H+-transporting ATPase subunit delta